jgi:hypothetical protein
MITRAINQKAAELLGAWNSEPIHKAGLHNPPDPVLLINYQLTVI